MRVLIAKDAISTGWDCPRAEVMVSFRAAVDQPTSPSFWGAWCARRWRGAFPATTGSIRWIACCRSSTQDGEAVVDALMKGDDTCAPPSGRVLINPEEMKPNPAASQAVWEKFESLPSQTRPQRGAKPAKRLTALAHELAADDILPGAGKQAHAEMHKVLDAAQKHFKAEIEKKRKCGDDGRRQDCCRRPEGQDQDLRRVSGRCRHGSD